MAIDDAEFAELKGRVTNLESWKTEHQDTNSETFRQLFEMLRSIDSKLTTFVNPVLAVVITALGTIIGLLAGALWTIQRM